ncbi:MAG: helix-turn-helix domain-containing protein, partial [Spirochaetaceae bacterium]|nr:helix-turn-helix domain-containing protein [Spirochaetaceae bacterium]
MPKKVFDAFFHATVRDIRNHYQMGDKYLSIRQIAEKYCVSIQTAQRGVKKLEEYGYITVKRKAGITIESLRPLKKLEGYRIAVASARADGRFNEAFLRGIQETAGEKEVSVRFEPIPDIDIRSLDFGDYLLSLDADGIIALYFNNSALPFYHVMREGRDIVADIILDELPILPVVQTDNFRHAKEVGRIFVERGYRRFLAVGYYPQKGNRRFEGMVEAVKNSCDEVRYIHLADSSSMTAIDTFFHNFNSRCAVYSVDYSANYIVGAKFIQHKIPVKNDNF